MAELLFIATTIFVAYVFFVVLNDKKDHSVKSQEPKAAEVMSKSQPVTTAATVNSADESSPVNLGSDEVSTELTAENTAETTVSTTADTLKNPKTGEISKISANYNFAKRWIKEALVEEGLLEKVYKSAEIDDEVNSKIHLAIEQLKALEKYQA